LPFLLHHPTHFFLDSLNVLPGLALGLRRRLDVRDHAETGPALFVLNDDPLAGTYLVEEGAHVRAQLFECYPSHGRHGTCSLGSWQGTHARRLVPRPCPSHNVLQGVIDMPLRHALVQGPDLLPRTSSIPARGSR